MYDKYADWSEVTRLDIDEIKDYIVGKDGGLDFIADKISDEIYGRIRCGNKATVLDFGCGLGRNCDMLNDRFDKVRGYDIPGMIESLGKVDHRGSKELQRKVYEYYEKDFKLYNINRFVPF